MRHTHFHDWGHHEPYGKLPPFRFWLQTSLPAIYDDSLTYLELAGRLHWYIDQIINTLKVYDDKFCELMGLYKELECYVGDYFSSVDFPVMVKDILDDMAATGKLGELLMAYINDFSIDAKKIKGGIVPLHYTYDHTDNGIEFYTREESDDEVLRILTNGSSVMGFFKGSPVSGNFIMYMSAATWEHNGTVKHFECGCVNTVYTNDFTITYEDFFVDDTDTIHRMKITDHYGDTPKMEVFPVYALVPDGTVTHPKLADDAVWENNIKDGSVTEPKLGPKSVTHPKLADDAVWDNNIKDRSVTLPKLAKPYTIFIGDDYDQTAGGWADRAAADLDLGSNEYKKVSHNGAGIAGSGYTFLTCLQTAATGMTDTQKANTGTIVIVGGYNDRDKDLTTGASGLASYIRETFPNAKVFLGMAAWKCDTVAGSHKYNDGYLPLPEKYLRVAGDHGWAFIDNMPYALHDYRKLDSTGLKPNAEGNAEIARAVAITVNGGTYHVHRVGHIVPVTADAAINLEPTSMNDLFPGQNQTDSTGMEQQITDNLVIIRMNVFHCIEFKNPTNLVGHMPAGDNDRKGEFDVFTFDPTAGFFEGANWYGVQYFPCSVKDSAGNVVNAQIGLRFEGNKLKAHLYKVKEQQTASPPGLLFENFDNVKFIHWSSAPKVWTYDAYMC